VRGPERPGGPHRPPARRDGPKERGGGDMGGDQMRRESVPG
jgi:hypothetical protein